MGCGQPFEPAWQSIFNNSGTATRPTDFDPGAVRKGTQTGNRLQCHSVGRGAPKGQRDACCQGRLHGVGW